jgi:predicted ATPase
MRFTRLELHDWRNFRRAEFALQRRAFLVGPNASGKSNLLDALRFLRDIAEPEGGFQRAVRDRGGVSQIRCLHARRQPNVVLGIEADLEGTNWSYRLEFAQDSQRRPVIKKENVWRAGNEVLRRPDVQDDADPSRLSQTHLEQVNANKEFRELALFLARVRYLHIVPQLIRQPERGSDPNRDPHGSDFLEQLVSTQKRTLDARLRRINEALKVAVPHLRELRLQRDERGVPHLEGLYEHWRPNAGWQTEEHFSDGTLRLLGLLWALLDGDSPLLLEEPELSLHSEVVRYIPAMMAKAGRKSRRQVLISTHSADLLSDEGIAPEEVVLLEPSREGTRVRLAAEIQEIRALLEGGTPMGDVVLQYTAPSEAAQLTLFGD